MGKNIRNAYRSLPNLYDRVPSRYEDKTTYVLRAGDGKQEVAEEEFPSLEELIYREKVALKAESSNKRSQPSTTKRVVAFASDDSYWE